MISLEKPFLSAGLPDKFKGGLKALVSLNIGKFLVLFRVLYFFRVRAVKTPYYLTYPDLDKI